VRIYLAAGLLFYVVFTIALFPVKLIQPTLQRSLDPFVQLKSVEGGLFSPELSYSVASFPPLVNKGRAQWSWAFEQFLRLRVAGRLLLTHSGLSVSALLVKPMHYQGLYLMQGAGEVDARFINQFLLDNEVMLMGAFTLEGVTFELGHDKQIIAAEGEIHYPGGRASYRYNGQIQRVDLPAYRGVLAYDAEDQLTRLTVSEDQNNQVVGYLTLDSEGWGEVVVLKRFLHTIGQARDNGDGDVSFFSVKEKFF
jgi:hypothetical protein